jgi:hypothetical protein
MDRQSFTMDFVSARRELSMVIRSLAVGMNRCFWKLSGDDPNSLCRFLCIEEDQLRQVLRLCGVFTDTAKTKDRLSKNNFDLLMAEISSGGNTHNTFKKMNYIEIGDAGEAILPKDVQALDFCPTAGVHFKKLQTKSQRAVLTKLLELIDRKEQGDTTKDDGHASKKQSAKTLASPRGQLFAFVIDLVMDAANQAMENSRQGHYAAWKS